MDEPSDRWGLPAAEYNAATATGVGKAWEGAETLFVLKKKGQMFSIVLSCLPRSHTWIPLKQRQEDTVRFFKVSLASSLQRPPSPALACGIGMPWHAVACRGMLWQEHGNPKLGLCHRCHGSTHANMWHCDTEVCLVGGALQREGNCVLRVHWVHCVDCAVPLIATLLLTCFILRCHGSCNMAPYSKNSANTFRFNKRGNAATLRRSITLFPAKVCGNVLQERHFYRKAWPSVSDHSSAVAPWKSSTLSSWQQSSLIPW